LDEFIGAQLKRRAILFDFLQIGELMNQLSPAFLHAFNNKNAGKLIGVRNRIVHGYSALRDDILFTSLKADLPSLITELNLFSRRKYSEMVKSLLGKTVCVMIDRPTGYEQNGVRYPINRGYIEELIALDGQFQDAYVLGERAQSDTFTGVVIGVICRRNELEDKLIVADKDKRFDETEIKEAFGFLEDSFQCEVLLADQREKGS